MTRTWLILLIMSLSGCFSLLVSDLPAPDQERDLDLGAEVDLSVDQGMDEDMRRGDERIDQDLEGGSSSPDQEVVDQEVVDQEVVDQEVVDQEVVDQEVVDQEVVDQEVPEPDCSRCKGVFVNCNAVCMNTFDAASNGNGYTHGECISTGGDDLETCCACSEPVPFKACSLCLEGYDSCVEACGGQANSYCQNALSEDATNCCACEP